MLLWAAAPVGAYLVSSRGLFWALAVAAGLSYVAYKTVLSGTERDTIERAARNAGYISDLSEAIRG